MSTQSARNHRISTSIVPLCFSFNDVSTLSSEISGECLSGLVRLSLSSCVDFVAGEEGGLDLEYSSSSKMEAVVELEGVGELVEGKKYASCKCECGLKQEAGEIFKYNQVIQNFCMWEFLSR